VLRGEAEFGPDATAGCRFAFRCAFAMEMCWKVDPEPFHAGDSTTVRCHLHTAGPELAGRSVWNVTPTEVGTARSPQTSGTS
jgi:hypothetical protein